MNVVNGLLRLFCAKISIKGIIKNASQCYNNSKATKKAIGPRLGNICKTSAKNPNNGREDGKQENKGKGKNNGQN